MAHTITPAQAQAVEVCRSMAQAYGGPAITTELLEDGSLCVRALHMDDDTIVLGVVWVKPNGLTPAGSHPADILADRIDAYNENN